MSSMLRQLLACVCLDDVDTTNQYTICNPTTDCSAEQTASEIVDTLYKAEKNGEALRRELKSIVTTSGWTEYLAEAVLKRLEDAIKKGTQMGQVMKDAFDRATGAAWEFAKDHPVFCTIIALGILVELLPWVIEAIGFGELGPIAGSFAARWMARYEGYVQKGSLYSYLQRLGMIWKR